MNVFGIMGLGILLILAGCVSSPPVSDSEELTIAATFFPLYDWTKTIVKENGTVFSVVPAGIEPHDFEANPSDIVKVNESDAFVTMGVEFAHFEDLLIESVNSSVKVIPAGVGVVQLDGEAHDHEHEEGEEEHMHEEGEEGHDHEEFLKDPHIWLSPKNAKIMVTNIMNGLVAVDPAHANEYTANGNQLLSELSALDMEYVTGLSSCQKDTILVSHNAFSYLAQEYGFETLAISGLEPESEPSPGQIAQLIDAAKEHNLKYVFYEELVDPKVAQTIADEVGAQALELSPVEGGSDPSDTYITLMRQNLVNLQLALECE